MDYAETLTAERVRRVMEGYGNGDKRVPGLGGSFDFYVVGERSLFDEDGNLDPLVNPDAVRRYIAWSEGLPPETVQPTDNPVAEAFVGEHAGQAVVFHYDPAATTTLDFEFLERLSFPEGRPEHVTVYADYCTLTDDVLKRAGLTFKKIPRDVSRL